MNKHVTIYGSKSVRLEAAQKIINQYIRDHQPSMIYKGTMNPDMSDTVDIAASIYGLNVEKLTDENFEHQSFMLIFDIIDVDIYPIGEMIKSSKLPFDIYRQAD